MFDLSECGDNQVIVIMIIQYRNMSVWWRTVRCALWRINAPRYLDNSLRLIVHPYVHTVRGHLMYDNGRPHRDRLVEAFLKWEGIGIIHLPSYSPDLNPSENVWDYLGRHIRDATKPPSTLVALVQARTWAWVAITRDIIIRFIRSMRQCWKMSFVHEEVIHPIYIYALLNLSVLGLCLRINDWFVCLD